MEQGPSAWLSQWPLALDETDEALGVIAATLMVHLRAVVVSSSTRHRSTGSEPRMFLFRSHRAMTPGTEKGVPP